MKTLISPGLLLGEQTTSPNPVLVETNSTTGLTAEIDRIVAAEMEDPDDPQWAWSINGVWKSYESADGPWTSASATTSLSVTGGDETSCNATLTASFEDVRYWRIQVHVEVAIADGMNTYVGNADCYVYIRAMPKVVSIGCVSGATQTHVTGAKNWATTRASGDVIAQVTLDPNTDEAGKDVTWTGGEAVTDHPRQHKVSKATAAKTNVKAESLTTSADLDVWVIWATVDIKHTGPRPTTAPAFPEGPTEPDGTQLLGPVTWTSGTALVGAGRIAGVVQLTPSGVGAVVNGGWDIKRDRIARLLIDGAHHATYWEEDWTDDDHTNNDEALTPDSNDCIYVIDGPTIGPLEGATATCEQNTNFREYVKWNGQAASDYAPWYYHAKWQLIGGVQSINPNDVNTGQMTLPPYN